jgi:hypothetical protein
MLNMVSPTKPKPPSPRKKAGKPGPESVRRSSRPSLRFYFSEELHRKTRSVLDTLEQAEDAVRNREALADVVVELTNTGLDSYFMEPLKRAKAGFLIEQSAALGMAGARKVMGSVIRNIIGRMDGPQLLSVCGSIRKFML